MFVVVGVTVVVNVASLPNTLSVLGLVYPVTAAAVPVEPTAVPDAVALILVVVGVTVVLNVASLPRTLSVLCAVKLTFEELAVKVVFLPSTTSSEVDTLITSLYANCPKADKSPNSHQCPVALAPAHTNSLSP